MKKQFYKTLEDLAEEETFRLEVLLGRALEGERLFKCGPFHLERFTTVLDENNNFCGEVITRGDGTVEYLKMYRLSRAESNRLRFLQTLARQDWELAAAAEELGFPGADGMARALVSVDLGYLLNPGVHARLFRK